MIKKTVIKPLANPVPVEPDVREARDALERPSFVRPMTRQVDFSPNATVLVAEKIENQLNSIVVTAPKHLEEVVADEVAEITGLDRSRMRLATGAVEIDFSQTSRSESSENDLSVEQRHSVSDKLKAAYQICLLSRTAMRVLWPLAVFNASDEKKLYAGIKKVRWSDHLLPDSRIAVSFVSLHSQMAHTQYGAQKTKDAICDQLRSIHGVRPSVDLDCPDVRIYVHVKDDVATVSIDLAGNSLHERGYRVSSGSAPMKETLAASVLRLAGWPKVANEAIRLASDESEIKKSSPEGRVLPSKVAFEFYDPMCGTGTLGIEAIEMFLGLAPGRRRAQFGFERWLKHDKKLWTEVEQAAVVSSQVVLKRLSQVSFVFSDADRKAVHSARENLGAALRDVLRDVGSSSFSHPNLKFGQRMVVDAAPNVAQGLMVMNPPYAERLGDEKELETLYELIGDTMKKSFPGWGAYILTGNLALAKKVGLKPSRKFPLFNGSIDCRLLKYELYSGTRRIYDGPDEKSTESR